MVADMTTRIEASRSFLYRAVEKADANDEEAKAFAAMAKLFCSDTAMAVTTDAVQLHGGYGYLKDYPVDHDARRESHADLGRHQPDPAASHSICLRRRGGRTEGPALGHAAFGLKRPGFSPFSPRKRVSTCSPHANS